ncbi:5' nucleotidase, NT5C type [Bacillus sp. T33-2]|uniref:5' nucleotidase, NT5C type n=1 Tax=Bacillus sp. T33-2 TaxID=2054168 RepID=UPI000C78F2D2|nr:5'-3'-deoxyribonucleotidase [Bacillus sp. T33-2]PLR99524.1 5'-3'-deoxyribonucleotidase [Bacillus sp. T33-2]
MKKVIAIDMDQVLADLLHDWVAEINEYEGENLRTEDIECWDIFKYVKCGNKVYQYLTYDLFRHLPVIPDSQRVVKALMEKYDVYVVTTATNHPESLKAKVEWLKEHFDFMPMSNVVLCGDKSIIKADIMIDDGIHNLEQFGGQQLLFDAPHNRQETRFTRVRDWGQIEDLLLS